MSEPSTEFKFVCPHCGQHLLAELDYMGMEMTCPACGKRIVVPKDGIRRQSTMAENEAKSLRKPTSTHTLMSCLNVKWLILFAVFCVVTIIILSIMLLVMFAQRKTVVNNSSHMANSVQSANSIQTGTPSELLLKYTEQGELSYIEKILKQNPALDVNRPRAVDNKTALYIACEKGYADIARFLLRKKADASICDTMKSTTGAGVGYSSLTIAAMNGHLDVIKVLLSSGVDIESRDDRDRTALYAAAVGNKPNVVRFLCESAAKVNIYGVNGFTPLTAAAVGGHVEVIKVLLRYGKGIDLEMCPRATNDTALYIAVRENRPDIVQLLCESNAKVNIYVNYHTPLIYAADAGFTEVIKILLKYGKDIDLEMRSKIGHEAPALYHAAIQGRTEAVTILCEAGADLKNGFGVFHRTPREAALEKGYEDTAKVLKKYEEERAKEGQTKKEERTIKEERTKKEGQTKKVRQISKSIVCCNLSNNSIAAETKSIAFLKSKPKYRCLKVRFTSDPKKADATFYFGWGEDALIISYTHDSSRADSVYNVVDSDPYWSEAETTVYIVNDASSPVDMTLCITHDESNPEAIKISEPIITSDENQQRVAIMYMLGFFK